MVTGLSRVFSTFRANVPQMVAEIDRDQVKTLGMVPLVIASGAGTNSRQALGTAVFSGMLAATVLLILFVPAFYALIQRIREISPDVSPADHSPQKPTGPCSTV